VTSIKKYFEKQVQAWLNDVEHDTAWRDALVDEMRQAGHVYTEDEDALIVQGVEQLEAFADGKGKVRSFTRSKTVKVAETKYDEKSGVLVGRVELVVGAPPEQIVAFLMHFDSKLNESLRNHELDLRNEVLEVKNRHHIVVFLEKKTAPGLRNRTGLTALLWKVSDQPLTYVWVGVPIERHDKLSEEDEAHAIRAKGIRSIRLTRISDGETKLEYSCSIDLMGRVPRWLTNTVVTPQARARRTMSKRIFSMSSRRASAAQRTACSSAICSSTRRRVQSDHVSGPRPSRCSYDARPCCARVSLHPSTK
jgi:hypothetical protein